MKKHYTFFILVAIGMLICGTAVAREIFQSDQIVKENSILKNHSDLKAFRVFEALNDSEPVVHPAIARKIPKSGAEVIPVSPGTLSTILTTTQKQTITNLRLTGKIDARDFKIMRDSMPVLSDIDLSEASITAYTGLQGTSGPTEVTYPENTIPQKSFLSVHNLISIIFPSNITAIGDSAFYKSSLTAKLILPESVVEIGKSAFESCWNLTDTLQIPNAVTTLGVNVFADCQNINSLVLPNTLTAIGNGAFNGDWSLTGTLSIPNTMTSIGEYAFYYCSFTGVLIPNSVTSIGISAFGKCKFLSGTLIIPNSVTSIPEGCFASCARLTDVIIPTSITTIGKFAFTMSGLLDVTIPNSVQNIGDYAFAFTGHYSFPDSIKTIGIGAFYSSRMSGSIAIPNSLTSLGAQAFAFTGITDFTLQPDNPIFSVNDGVLLNKNQTRLIVFPSKKSGSYTLPDSVQFIDDYAFEYCRELTEVVIQSSVTRIGVGAFYECSNLISIKLPKSVTQIGEFAFFGCSGLKSFYVNANIPIDLSNSAGVFANTATCTLYVPVGSKSLYQSADQWRDYVNIVEMNQTTLKAPTGNLNLTLLPTVVDDGFTVDTGNAPARFTICNPDGRQLLSGLVSGKGFIDISNCSQGMYLVRINSGGGTYVTKLMKK